MTPSPLRLRRWVRGLRCGTCAPPPGSLRCAFPSLSVGSFASPGRASRSSPHSTSAPRRSSSPRWRSGARVPTDPSSGRRTTPRSTSRSLRSLPHDLAAHDDPGQQPRAAAERTSRMPSIPPYPRGEQIPFAFARPCPHRRSTLRWHPMSHGRLHLGRHCLDCGRWLKWIRQSARILADTPLRPRR